MTLIEIKPDTRVKYCFVYCGPEVCDCMPKEGYGEYLEEDHLEEKK
jgi:hypothetical protein